MDDHVNTNNAAMFAYSEDKWPVVDSETCYMYRSGWWLISYYFDLIIIKDVYFIIYYCILQFQRNM